MHDRSLLDVATIDALPNTLADADVRPAEELPLAEVRPRWNLATRIAFRVSFLYFTLYVLSTQMIRGLLPFSWVPNLGGSAAMRSVIISVAADVFGLGTVSFQGSGSGDKLVDYLQAFSLLSIAVAATAIWSLVDRQRPDYRTLNKWFRLFLRFSLGSTMVSYGMVKAMPLQMPAPGLQRLLEPFGHFSPMGVLWASIGASKSYEMFAGFMELICGVLLFVPQLVTLGAMVTFATAVHIFTLNMTYDVPVKLFSFHLILMSLVLMAPEAARLAGVIVFNRAAQPSTQPPLFRRRTAVLVVLAIQMVYGGYLVWNNYTSARQGWTTRGGGGPKSPLYGIWNIERMTIDGQERSPLVTDYGRWRRVLFQTPTGITFQRMDDTFVGYPAKIDVAAKTIAVTTVPNVPNAPAATNGPTTTFTFEQPDPEHLILEGSLNGRKLRMETRLFDRNNFLLVTRGFNWIQERPFNR
jgi:hypothetical protein